MGEKDAVPRSKLKKFVCVKDYLNVLLKFVIWHKDY